MYLPAQHLCLQLRNENPSRFARCKSRFGWYAMVVRLVLMNAPNALGLSGLHAQHTLARTARPARAAHHQSLRTKWPPPFIPDAEGNALTLC
jgi:hypothetical protein